MEFEEFEATKKKIRVDVFTTNYMLKVLEKDLSYWDRISLDDFNYCLPEQKLFAEALYSLHEDGFKGFETPGEFVLNATTGKYTDRQKELTDTKLFDVSLMIEKLVKSENFEFYLKNFIEDVADFKESTGVPKDEFEVFDFDTLEEDRARLGKLKESEEMFDFYPYRVAPQTVNTLVAPTNVGKSTLTAAMANHLASTGKVLILSTEETKNDITDRRIDMKNLEPLKAQKFIHESNLTQEFINGLFISLEKHNFKYLIVDYVNPHNIDIEADLAQKIDIFYQWLLNGAQEHNICVFAFIQSNAKAYNEKIDVLTELTLKPNRISTFTDGGIRAIVKSYSAVFLYLDKDKNRSMIACKGRQKNVDEVNGKVIGYDVDLDELEINIGPATKIHGGVINGKTKDTNFKGM